MLFINLLDSFSRYTSVHRAPLTIGYDDGTRSDYRSAADIYSGQNPNTAAYPNVILNFDSRKPNLIIFNW